MTRHVNTQASPAELLHRGQMQKKLDVTELQLPQSPVSLKSSVAENYKDQQGKNRQTW